MKRLLLLVAVSTLTGCALQAYPPYKLHDAASLRPEETARVKVARSFGGPAIYLTYVDGVYVLDFPSMKGYPKDLVEANRLEPETVELRPGLHTFRVNFAFSDVTNKLQALTLLTLLGSSPVSYATFRKSADVELTLRGGKVYQMKYSWNEAKGAAGVAFAVHECDVSEAVCSAVPFRQSNEYVGLTRNLASPAELMAR